MQSENTNNSRNPDYSDINIIPNSSPDELLKLRADTRILIGHQRILRRKKLKQSFIDADGQPEPKWLYHNFFYEGTLNIVFGDTGIGKTFLGYQWAFDFSNMGYTVIYACLELNEKFLRMRYPTIIPNENFERLDFNPEYIGKRFDFNLIIDEVRDCLKNTSGNTILFIDNIKAISLAALTDNQIAINVMVELKRLLIQCHKEGRVITVIVFAHIKKTDRYRSIEMNDMAGAKDVQIFLDNLIGMGQSGQHEDIKYLVHLKARNGQRMKNAFILKKLIDENGNHYFEEEGEDDEINHLPKRPEGEPSLTLSEFELNVLKLKKCEPPPTNYSIAKELGKQDVQVKRAVEKLIKLGMLPKQ